VAVFGCGPVGQFVIASAKLMNSGRIIAVDHHEDRLAVAEPPPLRPAPDRAGAHRRRQPDCDPDQGEAARGLLEVYRHFDQRATGWTKVGLKAA
jgi:hypothetical protein